jgi:hypothetical protein
MVGLCGGLPLLQWSESGQLAQVSVVDLDAVDVVAMAFGAGLLPDSTQPIPNGV